MNFSARPGKFLSLCLLAALGLVGCLVNTPSHYMRDEIAQRVAHPAWMVGREIPAGPFALKAYERVYERGQAANLYIEGDGAVGTGDASEQQQGLAGDPTPLNPVALHLASKDKARNVIYLARPCQYTGIKNGRQQCPSRYWRADRYSPEVVLAYQTAMDELRRRYDISGFHLIGYDGGAAIAAMLAAKRKDVLSLRSVAGRLDEVRNGPSLTDMPQTHFIGGQDEDVPPAVLHQYLQNLGPTHCARYSFIQEASHDKGWVDKWPDLLREPVSCHGEMMDADDFNALELLPPEEGVFTTREMPAKP